VHALRCASKTMARNTPRADDFVRYHIPRVLRRHLHPSVGPSEADATVGEQTRTLNAYLDLGWVLSGSFLRAVMHSGHILFACNDIDLYRPAYVRVPAKDGIEDKVGKPLSVYNTRYAAHPDKCSPMYIRDVMWHGPTMELCTTALADGRPGPPKQDTITHEMVMDMYYGITPTNDLPQQIKSIAYIPLPLSELSVKLVTIGKKNSTRCRPGHITIRSHDRPTQECIAQTHHGGGHRDDFGVRHGLSPDGLHTRATVCTDDRDVWRLRRALAPDARATKKPNGQAGKIQRARIHDTQ
jgi:hypothetical protein